MKHTRDFLQDAEHVHHGFTSKCSVYAFIQVLVLQSTIKTIQTAQYTYGTRCVVTSETGLAHTGTVINNKLQERSKGGADQKAKQRGFLFFL